MDEDNKKLLAHKRSLSRKSSQKHRLRQKQQLEYLASQQAKLCDSNDRIKLENETLREKIAVFKRNGVTLLGLGAAVGGVAVAVSDAAADGAPQAEEDDRKPPAQDLTQTPVELRVLDQLQAARLAALPVAALPVHQTQVNPSPAVDQATALVDLTETLLQIKLLQEQQQQREQQQQQQREAKAALALLQEIKNTCPTTPLPAPTMNLASDEHRVLLDLLQAQEQRQFHQSKPAAASLPATTNNHSNQSTLQLAILQHLVKATNISTTTPPTPAPATNGTASSPNFLLLNQVLRGAPILNRLREEMSHRQLQEKQARERELNLILALIQKEIGSNLTTTTTTTTTTTPPLFSLSQVIARNPNITLNELVLLIKIQQQHGQSL